MSFFNSGLFWFLEGVCVSLAAAGLKAFMDDRAIPMPFWKWMLAGLWAVFFGFMIAFVGTSFGEKEVRAALLGGAIFGVLTVITGVGLWRLLMLGKKKG
ncbi:MAG: hypothetical protein ACE5LV_07440 [Candidatus Aminicenantales bacterium]